MSKIRKPEIEAEPLTKGFKPAASEGRVLPFRGTKAAAEEEKPMMGPYLTKQQGQFIRQRIMLEEILANAPPRIPSYSEMYPNL